MERETIENRQKTNLLLMGAAVLLVAFAVVLCLLLRPKTSGASVFVIRFGDEQSITVASNQTETVVIRDGVRVDAATGEGKENVIVIENGSARMEDATCPHHECIDQGVLNAQTSASRPLGPWIICAPHGVSVELRGGGQ